jgi:stage II sporulation protein D (peptidoglycan lytic transglycosylase)
MLVAAVVVAGCTGSQSDRSETTTAATGTTSVAPPSESSSPSSEAPGNTVRVIAPHHGSLLVHGRYPHVESSCKRFHQPRLEARYPGLLAVKRASDGTLSLTVTLPFERYLEGIAEVPPSWPTEALEAQAIAARSYALATTGWSGQEGDTLDTPICATTSCQVYGGMPIGAIGDARRWFRAVRRTTGRVLLYEGRPADTVYFSTSNGHTYGNEDVFGSSPLPYLRPVPEHDDTASPTSHWSVTIPFGDLAAFLERAGDWPSGTPIGRVQLAGGSVRISGGGQMRSIDLGDFRDAVNGGAPCLMPGRYPPAGLPTTIPSSWLSMSIGPASVTVTGRGWGHGVGMVQWGAYGKARLGWSADRILGYYYGGLQPQVYPEPGLIHVRVASGLSTLKMFPSRAGAKVNGERVGRGPIVIGRGELLGPAS